MGGYSQGWMGQTSGSLGGGRPLIQGPLISKKKRKQIKQGVNKFTGGVKEGVNKFTGGVKDLFTKDPIKNKYQSVPQSSVSTVNPVAAAAPEGGSLAAQMPGAFESDATALQSDAMSGQIYGGTSSQRAEAASLATGGPAEAGGGKGGKKGSGGGMSMLGPGLAIGSAALDALDTDPGYGGMDVGKEALKYAAMGAAAGPIGAGVGAVVGAGIGLFKKKKFKEEEERAKNENVRAEVSKQNLEAQKSEVDAFASGQSAANQAAYTGQDIDMFINKYAQ
jgi:hypothetical protein